MLIILCDVTLQDPAVGLCHVWDYCSIHSWCLWQVKCTR